MLCSQENWFVTMALCVRSSIVDGADRDGPQIFTMTSTAPAEIGTAPATETGQPGLALMGLAALGIVFGDIGTSPLYTLKTVFADLGGNPRRTASSACCRWSSG